MVPALFEADARDQGDLKALREGCANRYDYLLAIDKAAKREKPQVHAIYASWGTRKLHTYTGFGSRQEARVCYRVFTRGQESMESMER